MTQNTYPSLSRPGGILPPAAPLDGLRPVIESQILVDWVQDRAAGRVLDLGCGNGFMALALALRSHNCREIVGIDLHLEAVRIAQATANTLLADRPATVQFLQGDIRDPTMQQQLGRFDFILCNPPFFERKLGRSTPSTPIKTAHVEISMGIKELCRAARTLLLENGTFVLCHLARRRQTVLNELRRNGFEIIDIQPYNSVRRKDGGMIFIMAKTAADESLISHATEELGNQQPELPLHAAMS